MCKAAGVAPGPLSRTDRRALYRQAKKTLRYALRRRWIGSRASLDKRIRAFLRGRRRSYLLRLVRQQAFALAVAMALLAGVAAPAAPPIELSDIVMDANSGGFAIDGEAADDFSGFSVSAAGDVNGDGLDDLIIGAFGSYASGFQSGKSYVVFGKASGAAVELSTVAGGAGGFAINGEAAYDFSGFRVSEAGDVNGDGLDDLIVGAWNASPNGDYSGKSYVVFGKTSGTAVELSNVAGGTGGFVINGEAAYDYSGYSVSGAGDVNGDGLDDVIVGAFNASSNGTYSGTSYVVFGKADGTAVELSDVAGGTGGFVMNGAAASDYSGFSVSGAGDVNGDGLDDVIVGTRDAGGLYGASYVVFGKASTTAVDLSDVAMNANSGGFVMNGEAFGDFAGKSVSGAGDVNGDGLDDLIIGAYGADQNGVRSGKSYVVFGKASGTVVELSSVAGGTGGFVMIGEVANDMSGKSVSGAGDVNGDGRDDLIIGADGADPNGLGSGKRYVVFGKASGTAVELSSVAGGTGGFAINGEAASFYSGDTASGAGDVNGDGLADLIVGAWVADPNVSDSGRSYVVFSPEPAQGRKLWVDFAHAGTEEGTYPLPFDTLREAVTEVAGGGTINIKGDTLDSDSPEIFTGAQVIDQAVRITAVGGTVTIGNSAARDARRGGERP